jgi:hypothetical protein
MVEQSKEIVKKTARLSETLYQLMTSKVEQFVGQFVCSN